VRAKEFILENRGLPFPGTYEQEYSMFKRKGPRRIIAMTNEALDTPYEYNWKQVLDSDYVAIADLSDGSTLKIEFTEVNRGETLVGFERNGKIELTNEGDAFRIFATVMSAIKDYVEKFQPNKIIFSALKIDFKNDDVISYASRAKLYKRLVQMYASKLGYSPTIIDDPNKSAVDFILKKIKKSKHIDEALESSYPYERMSSHRYSFVTDSGVRYRVFFSGTDFVEVIFASTETDDDGWKASLTGTGDSLKVFGTVIKIIKDFIEIHQPETLYFTAEKDEPSRIKLYKTLLSRVDKELPNYVNAGTMDYRTDVIYTIKRKNQTATKSNDNVSRFKFKGKKEVNEVADNPYPYRPNIKTPSKRIYRFETDDGLLYRVQVFNRQSADNIGEITNDLEIHFDQTDKETGQPNSSITGTGDALRVFATVADILQKEVAQQNPTGLIITSKADDPSRVKLYRTLARRATKVMPQFEITGERVVKDFEGTPYLTIILKSKPNNK